jgi:hypothetical protein
MVACIPLELAVNRAVGAKMEVYLARTNSTDEGCVLQWTAVNASGGRTFEPLLVLHLEGRQGRLLEMHNLSLPEMEPGDEQTLDLQLSATACEELKYIDIVQACNIAPSYCNPKTCQYSDVIIETLHDLPSFVELGIEPAMGSLMGCLVPADEGARAAVLSSRPWRCGAEPVW